MTENIVSSVSNSHVLQFSQTGNGKLSSRECICSKRETEEIIPWTKDYLFYILEMFFNIIGKISKIQV